MMDKRSFTESILSRVVPYAHLTSDAERQSADSFLGTCSREDSGKPSVFAVTDLPVEEALPFFRTLRPLTRFGYHVMAAASSRVITCLKWKPQYTYCLEDDVASRVCRSTWSHVAAACSQDLLVRLALGLQDTVCAKLILQAIWYGANIYMNLDCAETMNGVTSKNNTLGELHAAYAEKLRNMGIKPVRNRKYLTALLDELVTTNGNLSQENSAKETKLEDLPVPEKQQKKIVVTQKDILSFKGENTIWDLPHDAIITSLAAEAAKVAGIVLRKMTH
jgi:hypothetical protein